MDEMLSVIVPVYNVQAYLKQCIESIINQTYEKLEIILVDDGSTDSSGHICDMFCQMDNRVKVIHKMNDGSIRARYDGILHATSKYITFVDGDDWIAPTMYENLMKVMIEKNTDMIISGYIMYWDECEWKEVKDDLFVSGEYNEQMIQEKIIPQMMWCENCKRWPVSSALWNKIFKRDVLLNTYQDLKTYKFYFADDAAVVYPYILESKSIYFLHECYYYYRQRKKGDIAPYIQSDCFFEDLFAFFKYLKNIFKKYNNKDELIKQLEYFYMTTIEARKQKYHDIKRKGCIYLFPFDKVQKGSRIVLYGAGRVGHEYYEQIMQSHYGKIVLWVDKNYLAYKDEQVNEIKSICNVKYDYIVIANASEKIVESIIQQLINLGVSRNKIVAEIFRITINGEKYERGK